jgi:hypothetical protein
LPDLAYSLELADAECVEAHELAGRGGVHVLSASMLSVLLAMPVN